MYPEDYGDSNPDIQAVRWGTFHDPPIGIARNLCYVFRREPTVEETRASMDQARVLAENECRSRALEIARPELLNGLVCLAPVHAARVQAGYAGAPVGGVLQGALPAQPAPGPAASWRAGASLGQYRYGDILPGYVPTARRLGNRDIMDLGNGQGLPVEEVTVAEEPLFFGRAAEADARVLQIKRNRQGRREITWSQFCESVAQEEFAKDWDLPGPRSALWCIEHINREGGGIEQHHEKFRTACKVQPQDWWVQEHASLCQTLHILCCLDQLDGTNLLAVETMFRRLQCIEYAYGDRVRETESRSVGGRMSLEEQSIFAGTARTHSAIMVCPALLEHVRSDVEADAKLAKALRLAREEREREHSRRKPPPGKKDKGGKGGNEGDG